MDIEGGVWVAFYGGSAVRRYGPDGALDEVLELPVTQVTACTFGGQELDELYITTSREERPRRRAARGRQRLPRPARAWPGLPVVPFAG